MKKQFFFCFVFLFFVFFFISLRPIFADNLFEDDFESGNLLKWEVIGGSLSIQSVQESKRVGAIVPSNNDYEIQAGNFSWENIEFSLDMLPVSGVDKNLFFRVKDQRSLALRGHNLPVAYGLHFTNSLLELQKWTVDNGQLLRSASVGFPLNTVTKITVRVKGSDIQVFINDSLSPSIQYTDNDNPLQNGRIALAVIAGASPTGVWYDNVVVNSIDESTPTPTPTQTPTQTPTPTPTPPTPVVFLPGLGACINYEEMFLGDSYPGGWVMTPGVNTYNNLFKTFEGQGYFKVFYYDWRKPILETAQKLNDFIKNNVQPWNNKVYLIGHSLGGLVARACVQTTANNCYAEKLITAGSPHKGAVDSYLALEGGEILGSGPSKLGYELFIRFNQKPWETKRETIERIAPVLKDLLPNFDYLTKNGANLSPGNLKFKNELLPQLGNLSLLVFKTHSFVGRGFDTLESISLTNPSWLDNLLGNWPDGKPEEYFYPNEGDNTVLEKSSSFYSPDIPDYDYNLTHSGIISDEVSLNSILHILGINLPAASSSSQEVVDFLVFLVHSPVKISVNNLPLNNYIGDNLIIIPDPENKNYQLHLTGIDNGKYLLEIGQIFGEKVIWSEYAGEIRNQEEKNYLFSINNQNPKENPLVDSGNTLIRQSLSSLVKDLDKEIRALRLKPDILKRILFFLSKVNANYPQISIGQIGLLRQAVAGYEKLSLINNERTWVIRDLCSKITVQLEFLAFSSPKKITEKQAKTQISFAESVKNSLVGKNLSKTSALIFSQAEEKLQKAKENLNAKDFWQSLIYATEAKNLFLESRILF